MTGPKTWEVFTLRELVKRVDGTEARFEEFLRSSTLSCAIYRLPIGAKDMQAPHLEDEVYFVVSGKATLRVAGKEHTIVPGQVLYVRATTDHSFFDIEEELTLIAVFAMLR